MAASLCPMARVPSRCTAETARAAVAFGISGYSLHKGLGRGKSVSSPAFSVGGYEWSIIYYPDGANTESEGYASVFLQLLTKHAEASVLYKLKLVEPFTERSIVVFSNNNAPAIFNGVCSSWGKRKFMESSVQQELRYVRNDRLVLECEVTVVKETQVHLPPCDLSDNLSKLLEGKKGADVTFKVQGEDFPAHKIVLAMRSPVFDAEFYGPMGDKGGHDIAIEDMQPSVFKAFLHFIYTDSMPLMKDLDDGEKREMVKHLLVAADRYGMERMKMMCESILCKSLDVETVATMLALADQHHCNNLEGACIEFISSANRMEDVMASQEYAHLKRSCPTVLVDMMEKIIKRRKI